MTDEDENDDTDVSLGRSPRSKDKSSWDVNETEDGQFYSADNSAISGGPSSQSAGRSGASKSSKRGGAATIGSKRSDGANKGKRSDEGNKGKRSTEGGRSKPNDEGSRQQSDSVDTTVPEETYVASGDRLTSLEEVHSESGRSVSAAASASKRSQAGSVESGSRKSLPEPPIHDSVSDKTSVTQDNESKKTSVCPATETHTVELLEVPEKMSKISVHTAESDKVSTLPDERASDWRAPIECRSYKSLSKTKSESAKSLDRSEKEEVKSLAELKQDVEGPTEKAWASPVVDSREKLNTAQERTVEGKEKTKCEGGVIISPEAGDELAITMKCAESTSCDYCSSDTFFQVCATVRSPGNVLTVNLEEVDKAGVYKDYVPGEISPPKQVCGQMDTLNLQISDCMGGDAVMEELKPTSTENRLSTPKNEDTATSQPGEDADTIENEDEDEQQKNTPSVSSKSERMQKSRTFLEASDREEVSSHSSRHGRVKGKGERQSSQDHHIQDAASKYSTSPDFSSMQEMEARLDDSENTESSVVYDEFPCEFRRSGSCRKSSRRSHKGMESGYPQTDEITRRSGQRHRSSHQSSEFLRGISAEKLERMERRTTSERRRHRPRDADEEYEEPYERDPRHQRSRDQWSHDSKSKRGSRWSSAAYGEQPYIPGYDEYPYGRQVRPAHRKHYDDGQEEEIYYSPRSVRDRKRSRHGSQMHGPRAGNVGPVDYSRYPQTGYGISVRSHSGEESVSSVTECESTEDGSAHCIVKCVPSPDKLRSMCPDITIRRDGYKPEHQSKYGSRESQSKASREDEPQICSSGSIPFHDRDTIEPEEEEDGANAASPEAIDQKEESIQGSAVSTSGLQQSVVWDEEGEDEQTQERDRSDTVPVETELSQRRLSKEIDTPSRPLSRTRTSSFSHGEIQMSDRANSNSESAEVIGEVDVLSGLEQATSGQRKSRQVVKQNQRYIQCPDGQIRKIRGRITFRSTECYGQTSQTGAALTIQSGTMKMITSPESVEVVYGQTGEEMDSLSNDSSSVSSARGQNAVSSCPYNKESHPQNYETFLSDSCMERYEHERRNIKDRQRRYSQLCHTLSTESPRQDSRHEHASPDSMYACNQRGLPGKVHLSMRAHDRSGSHSKPPRMPDEEDKRMVRNAYKTDYRSRSNSARRISGLHMGEIDPFGQVMIPEQPLQVHQKCSMWAYTDHISGSRQTSKGNQLPVPDTTQPEKLCYIEEKQLVESTLVTHKIHPVSASHVRYASQQSPTRSLVPSAKMDNPIFFFEGQYGTREEHKVKDDRHRYKRQARAEMTDKSNVADSLGFPTGNISDHTSSSSTATIRRRSCSRTDTHYTSGPYSIDSDSASSRPDSVSSENKNCSSNVERDRNSSSGPVDTMTSDYAYHCGVIDILRLLDNDSMSLSSGSDVGTVRKGTETVSDKFENVMDPLPTHSISRHNDEAFEIIQQNSLRALVYAATMSSAWKAMQALRKDEDLQQWINQTCVQAPSPQTSPPLLITPVESPELVLNVEPIGTCKSLTGHKSDICAVENNFSSEELVTEKISSRPVSAYTPPFSSQQDYFTDSKDEVSKVTDTEIIPISNLEETKLAPLDAESPSFCSGDVFTNTSVGDIKNETSICEMEFQKENIEAKNVISEMSSNLPEVCFNSSKSDEVKIETTHLDQQTKSYVRRIDAQKYNLGDDFLLKPLQISCPSSCPLNRETTLDNSYQSAPEDIEDKVSILSKPTISLTKLASSISPLSSPAREISNVSTDNQEMKFIPKSHTPDTPTTFMILQDNKSEERRLELSRVGELSPCPPMFDIDNFKLGPTLMNTQADKDSLVTQPCHTLNQGGFRLKRAALETFQDMVMENYGSKEEKSERTAPTGQDKPSVGDTVSSLEDRRSKIRNGNGDEQVAVPEMAHDKVPAWCNTANHFRMSAEPGLLGTLLDTCMGKEVGTYATNTPEEDRISVTLKEKSSITEHVRPTTKNSLLSNQLGVLGLSKGWLSDMRLEHDYVKMSGGECVSSPLSPSPESKWKDSSPRRAGMDWEMPNRMTSSLCLKPAAPTPLSNGKHGIQLARSEHNHMAPIPSPRDDQSSRSGRRSKSSSSVYRPKENSSEREQLKQFKNHFNQETATLFHALVDGKLKVLYDRDQKRWTSPDLKRFSLFRGKNKVSTRDACVEPTLWPYSLRVREKSPPSSTTTTTRRKTTVSSQSFTSLLDTTSDGSVVEGDILIMSLPANCRQSMEDDTDSPIRISKHRLTDWIREILPDIIKHKSRRHLFRGKDQFSLKALKKRNKKRNKLRLLLTKYMSPSNSYTTNNSASGEGPSTILCDNMNIDISREEAELGRLNRGGKRVSRKDKHTPLTASKRQSPGRKTNSPQAHTSRRYRRPGAMSETRRPSTSRNHSQVQPRPQSAPRKTAGKKSSAKQQMDFSPTKMEERNLKSSPNPTALSSPCVENFTEDGITRKFTPTFGSSGVSRVAQSLKGLTKPSQEPLQRAHGYYQEHVSTNLCEDLENDSLTEYDTLESCLLTPIMEESHSKDYASTEKSEASDFESFVIKCKLKLQDIGSNQEIISAGMSNDISDATTPAVDMFDQQRKFLSNQAMSERTKTKDNIVGLTHSEPALVTSPSNDSDITQPHCCAHDHTHEFICPHGNVYELHPDRVPHEIRYFSRYNPSETRAYNSGFMPRPSQREYFKSNFMRQEMQGGSNDNAVTDDLQGRNEYELMRRYINSSASVKRSSNPTRFTPGYTEEFNINVNWKIPLDYDRVIPSPKKDNLLGMKRSYSHHQCNFSPSGSLSATSRIFSRLCPTLNYNYMEPDYKSCYLQSTAIHFHDYFTNARLCKSKKQPSWASSKSTTSLGHRWLTADSFNVSPLVGDLARWNFNENANNGDDSSSSGEDHGRDLLDLSDRGQHEDLPSFLDSKYYPAEETVSLGGGHARADKPLFESGSSYKSDKHYLSLMDHVPYDESYCTCREHDCISYDYFQPSYLCNHVPHFAARNINGSGNMFGRNIGLNDDRYFSHRVIQDHIGDSDDDFTSATEDLSHFPSSSKKRPKLMRKNSQEMDDTCNHPESISYFMGDGPTGHFDAFEGIPKDDLLMGLSPMDEDLSSAYCSYKQKTSTCQRPQEAVASQMYSKDNKPREPDYESNAPAATGGQELDVGGLGGRSCCGQGDISTKHAYTQWYVDDGRVPQHGHSRSAMAPATTSRKETWSFPTSSRDIGGGEEVEEDDDDDDDEGEAAEEDDEGDDDDDDDEEDDDDEVEDGEDDEDDDDEDDEDEDEEDDAEDGNEGAEDLEDEEDVGCNKGAIVVTTGEPVSATANSLVAEDICQNIDQLDIERIKQANDLKVAGKDRKVLPELLSHGIARARDVTQNKYFTSESKALVRGAGSHMAVTGHQQAIGDHIRPQKPSGATVEKHAHKKTRHQHKFSLEQIKVPAIDKERVRFACDDSGDWAEIGRGSYGCVYLGLLDGIIEVAIKDFYESSSWDLVIHEARMLMFLQDTGITPKFYGLRRRFDVTKQPSEYCIIMEYFGDGRTLFNVMSEKMTLTGDEWLDIVGQLVAGLRLIHRKHVLINDLKADNILIDLSGGRKIIRYIDVGMATYKQGLTFQLPQDQMCKYNFLAPEVREGARTTTRSDIYSLGYMLEQMIRQSDSSLGGLKKLVSRCMEKNPARRPDIDDIVSQVHRFIASKASNSAPSSSPREQFLLTNSV